MIHILNTNVTEGQDSHLIGQLFQVMWPIWAQDSSKSLSWRNLHHTCTRKSINFQHSYCSFSDDIMLVIKILMFAPQTPNNLQCTYDKGHFITLQWLVKKNTTHNLPWWLTSEVRNDKWHTCEYFLFPQNETINVAVKQSCKCSFFT